MRTAGYFLMMASVLACGGESAAPTDDDASGGFGGTGGVGGAPTTTTGGGGSGMTELPPTFTVEGVVVDENGAPVEGAFVLQGGLSHLPPLLTGADGAFSIEINYPGFGVPGVVATKQNYRSRGDQFYEVPTQPITLEIASVQPPDNPAYNYEQPGTGVGDPTTKFCGHCHEAFAQDFQLSKHRGAANNSLVQDLFAGVASSFNSAASCATAGGSWQQGLQIGTASTAVDKCYIGSGALPDLNVGCGGPAQLKCDDPALGAAPTAFGACADCHAPGISGLPGGRNLHDAVDIAIDNGVFCDVCHKVAEVNIAMPPGVGAGLRLRLQRPNEPFAAPTADFAPLMFGPLIDVPNGIMGASYQPQFDEALFCAGCHEQKQAALVPGDTLDAMRWPDGLPVHSTYQEWLDGPFAASDTPCQSCHMPPHDELINTIDTATLENASITFGYPRPPEDRREHVFRGPLYDSGVDPRLIDTATFPSIVLTLNGNSLEATVDVANIGCGHAVPTGEPMRSLVMMVEAEGTGCTPAVTGGMTIYDVGGAHARGVEGADVTTAGTVLTWANGSTAAQAGMVVRVVRPSGVYDDYTGVGFFTTQTPQNKGLEIMTPIASANVVNVGAGQLTVDSALTLLAGDVIYLGDAGTTPPIDGQTSQAMAGAAGYAFARVLTDASGARQVPHHRAVDIASDNRIPPGQSGTTTHTFDVSGCTAATVRMFLLYRPLPLTQAKLRGWTASDYVIATTEETTTVP